VPDTVLRGRVSTRLLGPKSTATVRKEAKSVHAPQWFAQVAQSPKTKASLADKATPAHPVLASFQVEQAGPKLRIVDGDGSVYSGYLQIAAAARPRRSAKTEAARASHGVKTGWPAVFLNHHHSCPVPGLASYVFLRLQPGAFLRMYPQRLRGFQTYCV
jgi:hypothetical protein